ncbi:MAG: peptidoglycan-binding protein LysM [Alphaproteobacteria bacterium]|nr:peptidoglycan-binding protein LysM [Alphaproteobacteria bacterium]
MKDAGKSLFGSDEPEQRPPRRSEGSGGPWSRRRRQGRGVGRHGEDCRRCPTQEAREKLILAAGNVLGVAKVEEEISVADDAAPATFHTVAKGDTLWAVASKAYGDGSKYMAIFEANKPMLSDPDKIYPGQVLRIPAKG